MFIEEYKNDIENILQNGGFSILQKLSQHCHEFQESVNNAIENTLRYEAECARQRNINTNKILELQHEIDAMKSEIDNIKLQQIILDKKIQNAIKHQEKLVDEIEVTKANRNSLSLELVDLKQAMQERKQKKVKEWDAIKRASRVYKEYLDFHIKLEESIESERIKISFFIHNEETKNKYYVYLCKQNEYWEVEEIQPTLRKEHLSDLNNLADTSEQSHISNITAFLCHLRNIFLKYYVNVH